MAKKTRSKKTAKKSSAGTDTVVRTYRFHRPLYDEFEEYCARNLLNPKLVIEASILRFMESDPKERAAISERHLEAVGRE